MALGREGRRKRSRDSRDSRDYATSIHISNRVEDGINYSEVNDIKKGNAVNRVNSVNSTDDIKANMFL